MVVVRSKAPEENAQELVRRALIRRKSVFIGVGGGREIEIEKMCFDFDGTLIDSIWIMQKAFLLTLRHLLEAPYSENIGNPCDQAITSLELSPIFQDFENRRVIMMLKEIIDLVLEAGVALDKIPCVRKANEEVHPKQVTDLDLELLGLYENWIHQKADVRTYSIALFGIYEDVYSRYVQKIVETNGTIDKYVYPGVSRFLGRMVGVDQYIVSGGSLPRVHIVAEKSGLARYFPGRVFCPAGVERLVKGGRYKIEHAMKVAGGERYDKVMFFDDNVKVIRQFSDLGFLTVGIVHREESLSAMLLSNPSYILTMNLCALNEHNSFQIVENHG